MRKMLSLLLIIGMVMICPMKSFGADTSPIQRAAVAAASTNDIGWIYEDGIWFYRDENGKLCHGWRLIGEKYYYFDPSYAYMYANGWQYVQEEDKMYYFTASGDAYTGWQYDSQYGDWYYYYVGQYMTGWVQSGSIWYYVDNGRMVSDKQLYEIGGAYYGFKKNGEMLVGWNTANLNLPDGTTDVEWYYYNIYGRTENGWIQSGDNWYYCLNGWAVDDGVRSIEDVTYAFDSNGVMITDSWYYDSMYKEWYYVDENGRGHQGWLEDNGVWYYCVDGKMLRDCWYQTGTNIYSQFNSSGVWIG